MLSSKHCKGPLI